MPFKHAAFTVMMPEYTLAEAAALLRELGYDGIEWRVHNVPSDPMPNGDFWRGNKATIDITTIVQKAEQIRKITDDLGLEVAGLGTYVGYRLMDEVERCMEASKILGCNWVRVAQPTYDSTEDYNDAFEEALEGYSRIEDAARNHGIRAVMELHHGRICASASSAFRLVSNFDPDYIGVILDPGNMCCEGFENWQLGIDLLGPYVAAMHVKNAVWEPAGTDGDGAALWKTRMVPLKDGFVHWPEVIAALDRSGFSGWVAIEDFSAGDTRSKLVSGIDYLKKIEKDLGVG